MAEFSKVFGDFDSKGCEFSGIVVISQSYENKPTPTNETQYLPYIRKCCFRLNSNHWLGIRSSHLRHGYPEALQVYSAELTHIQVKI